MDKKIPVDSPVSPAESRRVVFTASPNAYVTYAQMLELMDGLPLDKQQAVCRYLTDCVEKKAHDWQSSKHSVSNRKKVNSNERER